MEPLRKIENRQVDLKLLRDDKKILEIFKRDYFDAPICYFPDPLLKALAKWICKSDQLFLVIAEVDGKYAGFSFGHTLGANSIWKRFARAHFWHFPGLFLVWVRIHFLPWVRNCIFGKPRGMKNSENLDKLHKMNLPRLDRPFAWSPDDPKIGCAELTIILDEYRGLGLGPQLVNKLFKEISDRGAYLVETHVDSDNYAAVRYLLKAGWEAFETTGGDFYIRKTVSKDQT